MWAEAASFSHTGAPEKPCWNYDLKVSGSDQLPVSTLAAHEIEQYPKPLICGLSLYLQV